MTNTIDDAALRLRLSLAAEQARKRLRDADVGSSMTIECEIRGDIQFGQLSFVWYVDCSNNRGSRVKASSLDAAIGELLRRMGFDERHAPLMLEAPEAVEPVDEPEEATPEF